jgi:hypothetical protein
MAGKRVKKQKAKRENPRVEESVAASPDWEKIAYHIAFSAAVLLAVMFFAYIQLSEFGRKGISTTRLLVVTAAVTPVLVVWFVAIVDILANKFEGSKRAKWLLTLALPVVGFVLYFIIGRKEKLPSDMAVERENKVWAFEIAARMLFAILFFSFMFSMAMKYSLNDPDVWWHLKTGDYIIENMEIPDTDHFAYTTPKPLTDQQVRGLRTQWLGQVMFALAEKGGGVAGVAMFRNVLILLPMILLLFWLIRSGFSYYSALGIVALPTFMYVFQLFYSFERPQAFSFLFVLIIPILLERLRSRRTSKLDYSMVLLPVAMAVWSNLHAGFLVGNFIICVYIFSEAVTYLWRRRKGTEADGPGRAFFIVCVISIFASFINPNTYHVFYEYIMGLSAKFFRDFSATVAGGGRTSWVEQVVLEFKPLRYFYDELHYKWMMVFWLFTAYPPKMFSIPVPVPGLLFICLFIKYWVKRKVDLAELLTVLMIWFFANYYARGLMFSLTVLPFYMGKTLMELRLPPLNFKKLFATVIALLLALTAGFMNVSYPGNVGLMLKPTLSQNWITPWYPILLSRFLEKEKIPGPMYNFYTWGGYLIWRLYPQYEVFIDGRAIDQLVSRTADDILKTHPEWQKQLDAYDINFIVIPVVFRESGHIIPLAPGLVKDDNWELVFLRSNSAVFVRNVPKNRDLIERRGMNKESVFMEIINVENILLMGMPGNPTYHIAKADALFALGRFKEAKAIYMRFPRMATKQLEELKKRGY